jgi:MFS family permease
MDPAGSAKAKSGWTALRHRGFALFIAMRIISQFGTQIIAIAVGWQVYDLTRNPADLGLVGLFQFAPAFFLILVTGAVADRYNRRMIATICYLGQAICSGVILYLTSHGTITVGIIFFLLVLFGVGRAFVNPATQSLVPNLVPEEDLSSAIALSSSSWQVSSVVGPAVGGVLYGFGAEIAYGAALIFFLIGALCALLIPKPPQKTTAERPTWQSLSAGFRYIWSEKIVFGAISLDLFAVLLGGAFALLPAFARDILDVGPWGLGFLRSASGVGSLAMGLYLTTRPIRDHAGVTMFVAVGLFGVFNIAFGLSTIVWLSILMLFLMGAADMISIYIRETLIQLRTPDWVRGRVNAVNMVFVGASNELGAFRAGMVAAFIGVVPAVLVGGIGTIAVAGHWAWWFPELRRIRSFGNRVRD